MIDKIGHRIYLAHESENSRNELSAMLTAIGHHVDIVTDRGHDLIEACGQKRPDLLISSVTLQDMDGIEALIECGEIRPVPSIVISTPDDQEKVEKALEDHVMAYLAEPIEIADLRPSIYLVIKRFEEFEELRKENDKLRSALEARKWIDRAKGILTREHNLSEEEAHRLLQRLASNNRCRLNVIAQQIVEMDRAKCISSVSSSNSASPLQVISASLKKHTG